MTLSTARQEAQAARALDDDDPLELFFIRLRRMLLTADTTTQSHGIVARSSLNENFALAHGNMAAALRLSGQPDAAIEAVERSIRMSPARSVQLLLPALRRHRVFCGRTLRRGCRLRREALRERPKCFSGTALSRRLSCRSRTDRQSTECHRRVAAVGSRKVRSRETPMGKVAYARESDRERYRSGLAQSRTARRIAPTRRTAAQLCRGDSEQLALTSLSSARSLRSTVDRPQPLKAWRCKSPATGRSSAPVKRIAKTLGEEAPILAAVKEQRLVTTFCSVGARSSMKFENTWLDADSGVSERRMKCRGLVAFLASDRASFITAKILTGKRYSRSKSVFAI